MEVHLTDLTQGLSAVNLAGPAGPGDPRRASPTSTAPPRRSSTSTAKQAHGRRRAVPDPADRLRRRGRLRDPLPRGLRRARLGRADGGRQPHGLRPFGLEPQRILRLQKMHIIVGQDTDSESTPYGAAMPWIVKLDKERGLHRQLGARALRRARSPRRGWSASRSPTATVPTEGAVVVDDGGEPAGQVTSARYSPMLDRVIGMAWVPEPARARRRHDHDLRRRARTLRARDRRPSRSTTPTARCCAREPRRS